MKSTWLKLTLFFVSLVISVTISEFILNIALSKYQLPSNYQPVDGIDKSKEENLNNNRYEDIYEFYQTRASAIEVITVGDSYTNGGNVKWDQTYPFQLFLNFNKKIPVANMGICEDTSKGALLRIKNYFETKKTNTKTVLVLLVGAADIFYDHGLDFEKIYTNYIKTGFFGSEKIQLRGEEDLNFIQRLKTYKMFKYVFRFIEEKIKIVFSRGIKSTMAYSKISPCYEKKNSKECLKSSLNEMGNPAFAKLGEQDIRDIIYSVIYLNQTHGRAYEEYIEDFLSIYSEIPQAITYQEFLYNLVTFSSLQSKYSISTDILPILKESLVKYEKLHFAHKRHELDNSVSIIKALEAWSNNKSSIDNIQKENYQKIIELAEANKADIIFLNYPLDYKQVNANIQNAISTNPRIHFIDLNSIFNQKFKSGYSNEDLIGDWEHCTPLGYKIIADAVQGKILEITKNIHY